MKVVLYALPDGQVPVKDFLAGIDTRMRGRLLREIDLLSESEKDFPDQHTRYLGEGIYEIKTKLGTATGTNILFLCSGDRAVLLKGYMRKNRKDTENALREARDLCSRSICEEERPSFFDYIEYRDEMLGRDAALRHAYKALETDYNLIRALLDARARRHMTQVQLAVRCGIPQTDICRIENGTRNPSLSMLSRLAEGLGMQLKLQFIPKSK